MGHCDFVVRESVRRYLRGIRAKEMECRAIECRIECLRDRMDGMGAKTGSGGGGSEGDKMGRLLSHLEELEGIWAETAARCASDIAEAYLLCSPSESVSRQAVWAKEVEGMTWASVGRRIGYSERAARDIAASGYREIYHLMPETARREPWPNAEERDYTEY